MMEIRLFGSYYGKALHKLIAFMHDKTTRILHLCNTFRDAHNQTFPGKDTTTTEKQMLSRCSFFWRLFKNVWVQVANPDYSGAGEAMRSPR
jgi:hypothetical protein